MRLMLLFALCGCTPHTNTVDLGSNGAEPLPIASAHAETIESRPLSSDVRIDSRGQLDLPSPSFDVGKPTLTPESDAILQRVADLMHARTDLDVVIEVHTDSLGASSYNRAMSTQRAIGVGRWLINAGIDCTRVSALGLGETQPIAPNDTAEGRAQNRRVLFFVHANGGTSKQLCGP